MRALLLQPSRSARVQRRPGGSPSIQLGSAAVGGRLLLAMEFETRRPSSTLQAGAMQRLAHQLRAGGFSYFGE